MQNIVLLVDDDDSNRLVLSVLLEDDGFKVDAAESFSAAEALINLPGARYDVILLDQHLGDGIGSDLIPAIRARMPGARVILISGSIEEGSEGAAHVDAVVTKGVAFPELLTRIQRVTG